MKKTLFAVISVMVAVLASACGEYAVDYDCAKEKEKTRCEGDVLYTCVVGEGHSYWEKEVCDGVCKNNKCEECDLEKPNWCEVNGAGNAIAYTCSEDAKKETILCVNNKCDLDNKKCDCSNCVDGCEKNGACKQVEGCDLHDERGACVCKNGNTDRGDCLNICVNDELFKKTDGSCACTDKCKNGCNPDGSCACPETCKNGCNDDGTCACLTGCVLEGCESNGACKLVKGCDEHDLSGACICLNGNEDDGSCKNICISDELFNAKNGSCGCPDDCSAGCYMDGLCKMIGSCRENEGCNEYPYCEGNQCYCDKTKNVCVLNDVNGNHLFDYLEVGVDNKECWKDDDCAGTTSTGEKFCDNAMGYKCSIKCNDDSQCINGFICRSDGRCVSEFFTTVWDKKIRGKKDFSFHVEGCNGVEVCWDWKDGKECEWEKIPGEINPSCSEEIKHDYLSAGDSDDTDVTIKIKGELNGVNFYKLCANYATNEKKFCKKDDLDVPCCELLEVKSFGTVGFSNRHGVFEQCYKLKKLSEVDIPDPSKLKDDIMKRMFIDTCSFNSSIENWDVSNVTSMEKLFWGMNCKKPWSGENYCFDTMTQFNQPLNHWDVSKVKNMENVFSALLFFNQPLDRWDVSSVTSMAGMFGQCPLFNQDIGNWVVSNVTTMEGMFLSCSAFNQDLSKWDVSKVTNMAMMFKLASKFNQDLSKWNISNVVNLNEMFYLALSFDQDLSGWKPKGIKNGDNVSMMLEQSGMALSFGGSNNNNERKKGNICKVYSSNNWSKLCGNNPWASLFYYNNQIAPCNVCK